MLRIRIIAAAAFSLSVASIAAQNSYASAPSPANHVQQNQSSGTHEQSNSRDSEKVASAATPRDVIAPIHISQSETNGSGEKNQDYAGPEWGLVYVTGVLVIVTITLAIYTACLWRTTRQMGRQAHRGAIRQAVQTRRSLAIAAESVEAAKLQASDFRAVQSAHLVVEFAPEVTKSNGYTIVRGAFVLKNVGQTIATQVSVRIQYAWGQAPPHYPKIDPTPHAAGSSIAAGERESHLIGQQVSDERMNDGYWSVMIAASYRDIFGQPKIVQSCHMQDPRSHRFYDAT